MLSSGTCVSFPLVPCSAAERNGHIYEIDLSEILWYSTSRQWTLRKIAWKTEDNSLATAPQENGCYAVRLSDGCVRAKISISPSLPEVALKVTFENRGKEDLEAFAGGVSLPVCGAPKQKVTVPGIIYNDNPSASKDRIVPHIGSVPGEGVIVEEHRLPIPAANIEWLKGNEYPYITLLSIPRVKHGEDEDYWSLGVLKEETGYRIVSASGVLMFNGMKDVYYGGRCTPLSYLGGYRTLRSGETLEKTYYLSWGCNGQEGKGFRNLTDVGYRILRPATKAKRSCREMIDLKKNVLDTRYYSNEKSAGYLTFGACNAFGNISGRPEYYLYGWTGQAIRLAWCDCMLGLKTGEDQRVERAKKVVDFFLRHGESSVAGLMYGYYMIDTDEFRGNWGRPESSLPSRIQGESISDCLVFMSLLKQNNIEVPEEWETVIRRACAFLMDPSRQTEKGLYPLAWMPEGELEGTEINGAGMPCVLALANAYAYFREREYLDYAERKYRLYASLHMDTFEIPFAYGTLDAKCEDKETGIYFFTAAARLFELTGKECYREWGEIAADWILTFVYHWNTGFRPGSICAEHDFSSCGWPGVSVQNHHLDVFFPVYELYSFGKLSNNQRLVEMAKHVSDATTQGISCKEGDWGYTIIGEQGEHYYQTNYFQVRYPLILKYLGNYRGGMNAWNASWITAQVMSSALKFYYWERPEA